MTNRAVIYALLDADGAVLYVGSTCALVERLRQHRNGRTWWPQVATVSWHPIHRDDQTRRWDLERFTIGALNPPHNIMGAWGQLTADMLARRRADTLYVAPRVKDPHPRQRREWARLRWIDGLAAGRPGRRAFTP